MSENTGCVLIVVVAMLCLMALVLTFGETFGQRCKTAFPDSIHEQERCAYEMANGLRHYPTEKEPAK